MRDWYKNGGGAFPGHAYGSDGLPQAEYEYGMSLRDYIAIKAMAAIVSSREQFLSILADRRDGTSHLAAVAESAYATADAMLAERDRVSP